MLAIVRKATPARPLVDVLRPPPRAHDRRRKNPELIPNEKVLYILITRVWLLPANADAATERRFQNVTGSMKLNPHDVAILRTDFRPADASCVCRVRRE